MIDALKSTEEGHLLFTVRQKHLESEGYDAELKKLTEAGTI